MLTVSPTNFCLLHKFSLELHICRIWFSGPDKQEIFILLFLIKKISIQFLYVWSKEDKNNNMVAGVDFPGTWEFSAGTLRTLFDFGKEPEILMLGLKTLFDVRKEVIVNLFLIIIMEVQDHRPLAIPSMGVKILQVQLIVLLY
jgi:hypothetical protein